MQITLDEVLAHSPFLLLPPDPEFAENYASQVRVGRAVAASSTVAFVAICRNAMPWLPMTLGLIEEAGAMFREWSAYIYENDSADDTRDVLGGWADGQQRQASLNINGRPHLNGTIEPVRTRALAEYRAECQRWVRQGDPVDYVIVFDADPWGGFSVDGIANSLAWMHADPTWYAMASYSWCEMNVGGSPFPAHYDAFAARLNHWQRRDQQWFHHWKPPVGSPPVEFRSAFGQLCLYREKPFIGGTYGGEDCEHVVFHRSIHERTGMRLGLNPSSRCVSFWVPHGG
jgi:hypothetical protein